jgi:hypothetical protein
VPPRSAVDPTDFLNLLPQVFILGRRGPGQYHFRLVGGFIADLHGRDLRQDNLLRLWQADDRSQVQTALEAIRRRAEPLVIDCDAHPQAGPAMHMEITFAPLTGAGGDVDRIIGLYQPLSPVRGLMGQAALSLSVRAMSTSGAVQAEFPRLRLAAADGKRIA